MLEPPNFRLTSPLLFVVPWAPARLTKSVKATTFALATPAPSFLETTFITIPLPVVVVPAAVARAAIAGRGANAGYEKQFADPTGIIFFECRRISRVKISPHRGKIGLINSYTIDLKVLNVREKVRVPFSRLF